MTTDWLASSRVEQLAMAENWSDILTLKAPAWNVPTDELIALDTLRAAARIILEDAQVSARSFGITSMCKIAFDELTEKMSFLKNRFFLAPPLTDLDLVSLGINARDAALIPPPTERAEAEILRPGGHLLELFLRVIGGSPPRGGAGYRVYWGVLPGGDIPADPKRELIKTPSSGEELLFSRFTKRKRERFEFDASDSGKTAYFCVRLENAKGEAGPWGALFSAAVP